MAEYIIEMGDALYNEETGEAVFKPTIKQKLIRCKDCKWYGRADKRRFYRGMDCLQKRICSIVPDRDYCSRAEREEDNGLD